MLSVNAQGIVFRSVFIRPKDKSRVSHVFHSRIHINNLRRENRGKRTVATVIFSIENHALRTVRHIRRRFSCGIGGDVIVRNRRDQAFARFSCRAYALSALQAARIVIRRAMARGIIPLAIRSGISVIVNHHPVRIRSRISPHPVHGFRNFARHTRLRIGIAHINAAREILTFTTESNKALVVCIRRKIFVEAVFITVIEIRHNRIITRCKNRQQGILGGSNARFRSETREAVRALRNRP